MVILNLTKNSITASKAVLAQTFRERLFGMIGRDFSAFDAMVFDRCNAIHTLFMKIPLDVIFVSGDYRVLKTKKKFSPWRPFLCCKNSFYVIELPVGSIERSGTAEGDVLDLGGVLTPEAERKWNKHGMLHAVESNAAPLNQRIDK